MTLLTTCAACGTAFQAKAKQCGRCKTPYCNATCQTDHWRREHKQMCKKIHRAGDAEQYHADKKYKEAVADAVEACADDTKGQTCFICTEAIEPRTGEGLVRGCGSLQGQVCRPYSIRVSACVGLPGVGAGPARGIWGLATAPSPLGAAFG